MLGAIVATVITLLVTAGLPARRGKLLYDPEVTNGKILVGLEDSASRSVSGLYHLLSAPRGAVVKIV
jgi:hypothetical protein